MQLKPYTPADAETVRGWILDETSCYQWSADRIGHFPFSGGDLNAVYDEMARDGGFFPLMAYEDGAPVGHLFIRYPNADDRTAVRFGFIVVAPSVRGRGYGSKLLRTAISYAKETLGAKTVLLGVMRNNPNARKCYEAVGFAATGETTQCTTPLGVWDCDEMVFGKEHPQ